MLAWRLLSNMDGVTYSRDWVNDSYHVSWRENDKLRKVRASLFKETWTTFDPELIERDYLPVDRRKGLTK